MVNFNLKDKFKNGELDLSSCGLKEIPKDIVTLKNITSLNLSNNKISSVGKIIGNLTHLNKLDLSRNHIKGLPENIGNLTNLKHLNLSYNQIATLPATISKLKNLRHLDLRNNSLAPKFVEIVGPCQNESQCQQAAKNVLKTFSSQSDSEKKKQNTEQESKKKKNDKKTQNGGINQPKQKNKKSKSSGLSIIQSFMHYLKEAIKFVFSLFLVFLLVFYWASLWNQPRYYQMKAIVYPYCHSALTTVATEEQAYAIEANLVQTGNSVNATIVAAGKLVVAKSISLYEYVTTDKTILGYVDYVKTTVSDFYNRLTKQKS